MGVKRPKNERVVRITVRRGARNNRGFFSPTRITQAVENPNEILLLRFGCVVLFDDARARRLCPPRKAAKMFFVVFREDYFLDDACRKVVASKRRSLSLFRARARLRKRPKIKRVSGLKNTRKNMCFLYLYLFLTTKTPQRAPLADVRAPTTPGRGGLARDGFESVVVFVRAFRRGSADDGETRDRRRDVVQTRTPGRRKARKEKSETRAARDGVAIARHG